MSKSEASNEKMSSKRKGIRQTQKEFWFFVIGFLISLGPMAAMLILQSSINIEESVGTISLGVAYLISITVGMFVTPIAIRRFGSKWVFMLGEFSYFIYVAANFYPKKYIMITAGVLVGVGEAFVWTSLPLYCWHFGNLHAKYGRKSIEHYVRKYTSVFWAMFQISQIFGNAISYAVLFGAKNKTKDAETISWLQNTTNQPIVISKHEAYKYCGANDCQNANVTQENIDKYVPDPISLYVLISIFCGMVLAGVGFHWRYLTNAVTKNSSENENNGIYNVEENEKTTQQNKETKSPWMEYKITLIATMKHMVDPKQLLITPHIITCGLITSFIYSEGHRAYTSCILGVEQVGAVVILFCATCGIFSAVSKKLIKQFGRFTVMVSLLILNTGVFLLCLFWEITEETKYLVYLIFFLFGCTDSLWRNCNIDMYACFFQYNQEISFNSWNIAGTFGFALGFLWSPLLCVGTKFYIQMGLQLISFVGYGCAELIHKKSKQNLAT